MASDAGIAGAKVAIGNVGGCRFVAAVDRFSRPWPLVAMRRDDHPFFAQWVPTLLPGFDSRRGGLIVSHRQQPQSLSSERRFLFNSIRFLTRRASHLPRFRIEC